ncbi:hypothetical protein EV421DRAFT_351603 [Armillaria borealis]|uniref:Uncharacterized protein n=1 Tax=Armillaria borealis TaxID=47425 RepID=A0AA39IVR4_9AGAR|nr:hypothetical protein EV421DRAFT_351603 [Armillaria borealis]
MSSPGLSIHYPVILVRIHVDETSHGQGVLTGLLYIYYEASHPAMTISPGRRGAASSMLRRFLVVLPWHQINAEGSSLLLKLIRHTRPVPMDIRSNLSYSYLPEFTGPSVLRSRLSDVNSPGADISSLSCNVYLSSTDIVGSLKTAGLWCIRVVLISSKRHKYPRLKLSNRSALHSFSEDLLDRVVCVLAAGPNQFGISEGYSSSSVYSYVNRKVSHPTQYVRYFSELAPADLQFWKLYNKISFKTIPETW